MPNLLKGMIKAMQDYENSGIKLEYVAHKPYNISK